MLNVLRKFQLDFHPTFSCRLDLIDDTDETRIEDQDNYVALQDSDSDDVVNDSSSSDFLTQDFDSPPWFIMAQWLANRNKQDIGLLHDEELCQTVNKRRSESSDKSNDGKFTCVQTATNSTLCCSQGEMTENGRAVSVCVKHISWSNASDRDPASNAVMATEKRSWLDRGLANKVRSLTAAIKRTWLDRSLLKNKAGKRTWLDRSLLKNKAGKRTWLDRSLLKNKAGKRTWLDRSLLKNKAGKRTWLDRSLLKNKAGKRTWLDRSLLLVGREKRSWLDRSLLGKLVDNMAKKRLVVESLSSPPSLTELLSNMRTPPQATREAAYRYETGSGSDYSPQTAVKKSWSQGEQLESSEQPLLLTGLTWQQLLQLPQDTIDRIFVKLAVC
jgi:hypothetical protein